MRSGLLLLFAVLLLHMKCDRPVAVSGNEKESLPLHQPIKIAATPTKWFNGHCSAVSLTFDIPVEQCAGLIQEVLDRSLTCDFEMITSMYSIGDKAFFRMIQSYYARGVRFFGHGHVHINFDTMSYKAAFRSIDTCYKIMTAWNLVPLVYGYPYGTGLKATTQQAVSDAGFICARGICTADPPYICADDRSVPSNWYLLPAVCIARKVPGQINDHAGMVKLFENNRVKRSWLIPMYHSVGLKNELGYYPMEDLCNDLDYLRTSDTWVATMDEVARYIKERNSCRMSYKIVNGIDDGILVETVFQDTLHAAFIRVPLTMAIEVDAEDSINRCEVTTADGAIATYHVVDKRFTMNVVPDGTPIRMRFYLSDE